MTQTLELKVSIAFEDDGEVDKTAVAGNIAAAIETWFFDGRITPNDDPDHAIPIRDGWSVTAGEIIVTREPHWYEARKSVDGYWFVDRCTRHGSETIIGLMQNLRLTQEKAEIIAATLNSANSAEHKP
jgi:hypothetical protein